MNPAVEYANAESQYFPIHWDEQTKGLVSFMIREAYQSGHTSGYDLGKERKVFSNYPYSILFDAIQRKLLDDYSKNLIQVNDYRIISRGMTNVSDFLEHELHRNLKQSGENASS